jgi:hypothetical protein
MQQTERELKTHPTGGDMAPEDREKRSIQWAGALVLGVLGLFAWTFYLERTACFDSAFFSWLLIDVEVPVSVLGRIGSWIPQVLPVALIRHGSSLELVLRSYSMSLFGVHVLVFAVLVLWSRDRKAIYALPVMLTAGFHYMFYYGISELYQGLSLTVLLWVLLRRAAGALTTPTFRWYGLIAVLLSIWISFYHQLLILPIGFLLVNELIPRDRKGRQRIVLLGLIIGVWFVVRIKTMGTSSYEQSRMPSFSDLIHYGGQWCSLNSTIYLLMVWTKFKAMILLVTVAFVAGLWRRAWLHTAWTLLFSVLFLLLVLVVDRDGMASTIYENYYPVLGLVWVVHLLTVLDGMSLWEVRLRKGVFLSVCMLGLLQIYQGHFRMSAKVAYNQRLTSFWHQQDRSKLLVSASNYPWNYTLGEWALGMESALTSAIQGPQATATMFVSLEQTLLDTIGPKKEQFLGPTWSPLWFGIPALDQRYFNLPTDTGYISVNTCSKGFPYEQLELRPPSTPIRLGPDRYTVIPILIHNPTAMLMPSCTERDSPVRLSYRLFLPDGTEYLKGGGLSALETDIPPGMTYQQGLVMERPKEHGRYWVIADVVVDGQTFGKYATFDVVVDGWPF